MPGTLVRVGGNSRAETLTVAPRITAVGGREWSAPAAPAPAPTRPSPLRQAHPLTRRRRTGTTRSDAAGAPLGGTRRRATAAAPRSGREPSQPGGCSPADTAPGSSQTPSFPQLPPHSLPPVLPVLTVQGCGRSPGSGQSGLRRQEWAASSAVGSRTPWRLRRSLLASLSKSPHSPATRPRNCGDSRTRTRVPGQRGRQGAECGGRTRPPPSGPGPSGRPRALLRRPPHQTTSAGPTPEGRALVPSIFGIGGCGGDWW